VWSWLASLVDGPILKCLLDAYRAKLDAANARDRLAADLAAKEIEAGIDARRQANALIIAEQGRWYTAIIRPLLAAPVIIYLWKVIVWDKVLGLGTTDPLTGTVAEWAGLIVTTYVGGRTVEKVARIFAKAGVTQARDALLLTLLPILPSCATTMASVGTDAVACSAFEPIRWSERDTGETIRQVKELNAVWIAICGSRRP